MQNNYSPKIFIPGLKSPFKELQDSDCLESKKRRGEQVKFAKSALLSGSSCSMSLLVEGYTGYSKNTHPFLAGIINAFRLGIYKIGNKKNKHLSKIANVGIKINNCFSMLYKTTKTPILQRQPHFLMDDLKEPPAVVRSPQQINAYWHVLLYLHY